MKPVTLHIDGMSCSHCLNAVNKALGGVTGVVITSVAIGRAEVQLPDSGATSDDLVTAVESAGFSVTLVGGAG